MIFHEPGTKPFSARNHNCVNFFSFLIDRCDYVSFGFIISKMGVIDEDGLEYLK